VTDEQPREPETIDLTNGTRSRRARQRPILGGNSNGNGSSDGAGFGSHPATELGGVGAATDVTRHPDPFAELDALNWFPSYDRESVERHLRELDAEQARLEAQIAEAERRTSAAQQALAARTAELESGLGAVVLAARAELDRIEREQEEAVAAIRAAAEAVAARIRQASRVESDALRNATASLANLRSTSTPAGPGAAAWPPPASPVTESAAAGWAPPVDGSRTDAG